MTTLDRLVDTACSYGAGKALIHAHRALIQSGQYDAAGLISDLFMQLRDVACEEAKKDAATFIPSAEQDVIWANRTRETA